MSPTHGMVIHVFEHVIEGINPMDLGTYSVTMDNGAILPDFSVEVMQFLIFRYFCFMFAM